jgi:hypothetical protein
MRVVYRLAEDSRGFASSGVSDRVASGEIPLHTSRGVITKLYMGSMNDWPEFTMRSDSGEESSWSRYGIPEEMADTTNRAAGLKLITCSNRAGRMH